MREPRFRAWDKKSKVWRHWSILEDCMCDLLVYGHIDKDTLGEFTGLSDTNSVEIYEGDIVQVGHRQIYPITVESFHGYRFMWGKDLITKSTGIDGWIIGNIHEHPELLEKSE